MTPLWSSPEPRPAGLYLGFGALIVSLWFVRGGNVGSKRVLLPGLGSLSQTHSHVSHLAMATNLIGPVTAAYITYLIADYVASCCRFWCCESGGGRSRRLMFALSNYRPLRRTGGGTQVGRVRDGVEPAICSVLAGASIVAIPLFFFGEHVASWIDASPVVIEVAAIYLAIVPMSYGLWGVPDDVFSFLSNALGKPLPSSSLCSAA